MTGIGKRLIKVRAEIGLKQGEFAERIGISQGMLSDIEHENKPLTERNIKLIHFTFGVNREWLLTGQGEMYNPPTNPPPSSDGEPLKSELIEETDVDSLSPDEKAFLSDYRLLTEPNKKVAKTMVKSLMASQAETEARKPSSEDGVKESPSEKGEESAEPPAGEGGFEGEQTAG